MGVAGNLSRGHREIWGQRLRAVKSFLESGSKLVSLEEHCKLSHRGAPAAECILDALH